MMTELEDIEVLRLSYEQPGVFGELFDRHQSRFLAIAKMNLQELTASEDAVQNTFVRIYKYGKKFLQNQTQKGDFKSWSNQILANCIKDEARKRKFSVELSAELESVVAAESEFPEYESDNFLASVFSQMDAMSAKILEMRFVLGKSFKQIGKSLSISSGAARVRAYRAKKYFVETYKQLT